MCVAEGEGCYRSILENDAPLISAALPVCAATMAGHTEAVTELHSHPCRDMVLSLDAPGRLLLWRRVLL